MSIDGPAGSGKTTIGSALAAAIGCAYVDTGLMYRAVAWIALERGVSPDASSDLASIARNLDFSLGGPGDSLLVDGLPPLPELRSPAVDSAVSAVSAHSAVRSELVRSQRTMACGRCIVMVGRDIGTIVLPDADVKLWVVASPAERARRRLAEGLSGSSGLSLAQAEKQIVERDARDANREVSPLKRPAGAIEIDTDILTPEQCVERAMAAVQQVLGRAHAEGRSDCG